MMPIYESNPSPVSNGEHHRLQYFYYEDHDIKELDMDEFDYTDNAIDIMLFYSAGLWRWRTRERRIQHVKWMLFVWQHLTIQDLPTAEITMGTKSAEAEESPSVDGDLDGEFELAFIKLESMKQEAAKIKADMAQEAKKDGADPGHVVPPPRLMEIENELNRLNGFDARLSKRPDSTYP